VLPEAPLKIYMTADVEQRVRWKYEQMRQLGQPVTLKEVRTGLLTRDQREMNRELDPLRPAQDAWILDTTDLTVEQIVERIRQRVEGVPPGRVTVKSYNA
jgi:cytidylate kinase